MKPIKYMAIILGILVVLYLFTMIIRQGVLARNLSIKPVNFRKNFISMSDTSFIVAFGVKNTMDIDITLKNIKINVLINQRKATKIHKKNIHIPAHSTVITEATVRFNPSEIIYDALGDILQIGDMPIRFRGHLDIVTNYFFWNRIKIDKTTILSQLSA